MNPLKPLAILLVSSSLAAQTAPLDPVAQNFLNGLAANPGPPIYTLSPPEARNVLTTVQSGEAARPEAIIEDRTLPIGPAPSNQTRIRIVRPAGVPPAEALPALLYAHGGGWALGDAHTHDLLIRRLANDARCAVIFIDYDRAPEARFPIAIEQAYAALLYAAEHPDALHIDASRLAIAGDSAGGQIAAAVTMLAKERERPSLLAQVLFYPVTDAGMDTASYNQFADGPWLTKAAMQWFWDLYLPDTSARANPLASPLRATNDQLRGLPPALVITASVDVLRDEGEAYAKKLTAAGVKTTSFRAPGAIHDFVMLNALADSRGTTMAVAMAAKTLRDAFHSTEPRKPARGRLLSEPEKIDRLLAALDGMRDAKFIRNGAEAPLPSIADHLRVKRKNAGDQVETARQFIDRFVSRSVVSGKPYMIKLAGAEAVPASEFLHKLLAEIESGAR